MSWKNLPSWLKGGVIGGIVGLILSIITFSYTGIDIQKDNLLSLFIQNLLIYLVITFIIGAIIGWIVGKFKKQKSNRNQPKRL